MKTIFLVAIVLLAIWLFVIANCFDKCKKCGAIRTKGSPPRCLNCGEEIVPKYPHARKIFFATACVLMGLLIMYGWLS